MCQIEIKLTIYTHDITDNTFAAIKGFNDLTDELMQEYLQRNEVR